jgi:hypothetical protein
LVVYKLGILSYWSLLIFTLILYPTFRENSNPKKDNPKVAKIPKVSYNIYVKDERRVAA